MPGRRPAAQQLQGAQAYRDRVWGEAQWLQQVDSVRWERKSPRYCNRKVSTPTRKRSNYISKSFRTLLFNHTNEKEASNVPNKRAPSADGDSGLSRKNKLSQIFNDRCLSLPHANTQCCETVFHVAAQAHFVDESRHQPRTRTAQWMPDRDRAAVDVDDAGVDLQILDHGK